LNHARGMSQMLKSSGAMGAATLTSRVLGLAREMVYAGFMGVGWVTDAFMLAFLVPNLFRRLLGEGVLTAAFIPAFKEKEKLAGEAPMWRAANAVISGLALTTAALVALGVAGVSVALAAGGFAPGTDLMLRLLRVMFPYLLLVCLAAVFMGMLNARGHFFIPALGATMLNVVMIASVLWLAPHLGRRLDEQIFGLAVGVVIAGIAQASFQWPLLRREGFRYRWVAPWGDDTVRRVVKQMIPGAIGVAAFQINVLLTQGLAFWVGPGIVSSFGYAVRLLELPQGVFGVSLATYLLPALAGLAAEKKYPEFRATLGQGLGYLVFITLLASALLFTLAEPMVRLLFERRSFDEAATAAASQALVCLAPGLVAFSVVNVLGRAFYALGDVTTPMKISAFCLALNLALVVALVWRFKQGGLGAANTVSAFVNVALLVYALRRKLGKLELGELRGNLFALPGAALAAGLAAWLATRAWTRHFGHDTLVLKLGEVFGPMLLATVVYFGLTLWLKISYPKDVLGVVTAKLRRGGP
jgi:putative peptidoglycan lipid II flippase